VPELNHIIAGCLKHNRKSQSELFKLFNGRLYAVALRYLNDDTEAKEVLQQAWIQIFSSLSKYSNENKLFAWCKTILIRTAWKYIRRLQEVDELSDMHLQIHSYQHHQVIDKMTCNEILKLLEFIPIGARTVFKLFVIEEWSHKEISTHLEISESTSRAHLSNARKMLKKFYYSMDKMVKHGVE